MFVMNIDYIKVITISLEAAGYFFFFENYFFQTINIFRIYLIFVMSSLLQSQRS